ncbi:MAG: uroporphyrinogen decarboxylase (URO-D) [Clostridiales Family XIII bacterium]|jgi:hypothetical protein|nr:uroporphyrinogen decarboxylase (URO-D) [Clostridiales Family XIII bacterium]
MYTKRENFLRTVEGNGPDRLVNGFEAFALFPHPFLRIDREGVVPAPRGAYYKDTWGTTFVFPEGQPGPVPVVTPEARVISDIARWREELIVPDCDRRDLDWDGIRDFFGRVDRSEQFTATELNCGLFERTHNLMGFEDALTNLLLRPDEMHALLDVLLEARIDLARRIIDECAPEVIISHDDFGAKETMFMSPKVWRTFFKERYRKLYGCMAERGVFVVHHGDSFQEPIAADMAEIGIRVWQGAIPSNDILALQKALDGAMTLMGGIAMDKIDVEDWSEAAVRTETRRACELYGPGGFFIPSITYGGPRSIYPGVNETIMDEVARYNGE